MLQSFETCSNRWGNAWLDEAGRNCILEKIIIPARPQPNGLLRVLLNRALGTRRGQLLHRPASSSQALSQRLEHVSTIEPCLTDWSMSQGEKIYTLTIFLFTDIQYFLFPIFVRIDIPYFWQDILKIFFRIFIFYFLVYLRINNPKNWPKIA